MTDSHSPSRRAFIGGAAGTVAAVALGRSEPASSAAIAVKFKMDKLGQFGAKIDLGHFRSLPQLPDLNVLKNVSHLGTIRSALSNRTKAHVLENLPPVSMQGTARSLGFPGSCEAQGFGYGLGTHTLTRHLDGSAHLDPTKRRNQPSAAWLFSHETQIENASSPSCGGSQATPYLDMLVFHGAPSNRDVPYKPDCSYLAYRSSKNPMGIDTNLSSYPDASRLRIGSYVAIADIQHQSSKFLETFKALNRAGHLIAFTGLVANDYDTPLDHQNNGAYAPTGWIKNSGHSQCIVGYDDGLGTDGAFLIQNSFGTDWPGSGRSALMQGRLYWTYESFFASQQYAAIAFPRLGSAVPAHALTGSSGAPKGYVVEAKHATTSSGKHQIVLELLFADPVRVSRATVRPKSSKTAYAGRYNGAMSVGFVTIDSAAGLPSGSYHVTVSASTEDNATLSYEGDITVS